MSGDLAAYAVRLWTLHPKYLDRQGLIALWREALLARAVLRGQTRGYRQHPQLERFKVHPSPRLAINAYLAAIHAEATARGYAFDKGKIGPLRSVESILATTAQIAYEWRHLILKLAVRDRMLCRRWRTVGVPLCHPLFTPVPGSIERWERTRHDKALEVTIYKIGHRRDV
jgi:Pyrimidine dimer DNA glycosylase